MIKEVKHFKHSMEIQKILVGQDEIFKEKQKIQEKRLRLKETEYEAQHQVGQKRKSFCHSVEAFEDELAMTRQNAHHHSHCQLHVKKREMIVEHLKSFAADKSAAMWQVTLSSQFDVHVQHIKRCRTSPACRLSAFYEP